MRHFLVVLIHCVQSSMLLYHRKIFHVFFWNSFTVITSSNLWTLLENHQTTASLWKLLFWSQQCFWVVRTNLLLHKSKKSPLKNTQSRLNSISAHKSALNCDIEILSYTNCAYFAKPKKYFQPKPTNTSA